jgi:hypothetical protein
MSNNPSGFAEGFITDDPRKLSIILSCLPPGETILTMVSCFDISWGTIQYRDAWHNYVDRLSEYECVITNQSIRTFAFQYQQPQTNLIGEFKKVFNVFGAMSRGELKQTLQASLDAAEISLVGQNQFELTGIASQSLATVTPRSLFIYANGLQDFGTKYWQGFFYAWGNIDINQQIGVYSFNGIEINSVHSAFASIPAAITYAFS